MKKSVDINVEMIVGVAISILVKGSPENFFVEDQSKDSCTDNRTDWSLEQFVDAK